MIRARLATRADVPALADVLAGAFRADPVWRWLMPDDSRWDRAAAGAFGAEVAVQVPAGHTYTSDDIRVSATWVPPGRRTPSKADEAKVAWPMFRLLGLKGSRHGLPMLKAMARERPREPHWYLAMLGTHPDHQGRGLGAASLVPVLERCDLDGVGAYLESSNPANVAFYERNGFSVQKVIRPGGSPPMSLMWRDPRPPVDGSARTEGGPA